MPFWDFSDIALHLRDKNPQNSQFWGVNRRFQAKLAKSKNVHIIKTTASIPTTFCTVIKTHALQIEKSIGRGLTDYDEVCHADEVRPS